MIIFFDYDGKCKPGRRIPPGYQIVSIAKDGNCLFNIIMDGLINLQLSIPSAWVTLIHGSEEEMVHRITNGKYGQHSERELMVLKYNITIRVYDAFAGQWIVKDNFVLNRSRQL